MQKKMKSPDLTRFGFYLFPKIYKNSMGFEKAHGLLFLDANGRVGDSLAKELGFTHLLNSSSSVLYAINPVDGKYPNASELLKSLSLGTIAKQRLITKQALEEEFINQCEMCGIDLELIDKVACIGSNKDDNPVYESRAGRYLKNEKGVATRDVPLAKLLYAVDKEGEFVESQAEYCLESLFRFDLDIGDDGSVIITPEDFARFVKSTTRKPPEDLPEIGAFKPISFYKNGTHQANNTNMSKMMDVLERLESRHMVDLSFDDEEAFEQYLRHIFYRTLPSTSQGFKTNLPAPLVFLLMRLMRFNGVSNPHIVSPYVGNHAMLAGLVLLEKDGAEITACEKHQDKQQLFNEFLTDVKAKKMVVHSEVASVDYDGCIGYLASGDTAPAVLIPESNHYSYKTNVVQMLDWLDRRKPEGRAIFVTDVDDQGNLGLLDEDSVLLAKYLYSNYQNVVIFDCHKSLSLPSRYSCEYRIYIVGEKVEDAHLHNSQELADLELSPKIVTIDSVEVFYTICDDYASEIAAVEISSVDLMDNMLGFFEDGLEDDDSNSDSTVEESTTFEDAKDGLGDDNESDPEEIEESATSESETNEGSEESTTSDSEPDDSEDESEKSTTSESEDDSESNDEDEQDEAGEKDLDSDTSDADKKEGSSGSGVALENDNEPEEKAIVLEDVDISDEDVLDGSVAEDDMPDVGSHVVEEPADLGFDFDDDSKIDVEDNASYSPNKRF